MRDIKKNSITNKTVIIGVTTGRNARDILRTNVLDKLIKSGLRIVVISPAASDERFRKEIEDDKVHVEMMHYPTNKLELIYLGLINGLFINSNFCNTIKIRYEHYKNTRFYDGSLTSLSYIIRGISSNLLSYKNYKIRSLLKDLNVLLFPDVYYADLFEKYKPSLVFTTHNFSSYKQGDTPLLKRAIMNKIKTLSLVPSWDNITSKGEMPVHIDNLIVWNEQMRREAIEFHGYSDDDVFISGVPQFDIYFNRKGLPSKEAFFKKLGLDCNKKLITYTAGTPQLFKDEEEIIGLIVEAIGNNLFKYPCQLLIRLNPHDHSTDRNTRYDKYKSSKYVHVDFSWRKSDVNLDKWDPNLEDMIQLANTMMFSDVVINVASTITIDAACFDTPIINIGFDGSYERPYWESVRRYYDTAHYQNIVKTGGVKIARDGNDLLQYINMYLEDPKIDSDGRKKIVDEQCYYKDGKSAERIAEYILKQLG